MNYDERDRWLEAMGDERRVLPPIPTFDEARRKRERRDRVLWWFGLACNLIAACTLFVVAYVAVETLFDLREFLDAVEQGTIAVVIKG